MKTLTLILTMLVASLALADEKTWGLFDLPTDALVAAGLSAEGVSALTEYGKTAKARYEQASLAAVSGICERADFYAAAPEHLAQAIDDADAALRDLRHTIGEGVFSVISKSDQDKLAALQVNRVSGAGEPRRNGDPIRFGKVSAPDVISTMCPQETAQ